MRDLVVMEASPSTMACCLTESIAPPWTIATVVSEAPRLASPLQSAQPPSRRALATHMLGACLMPTNNWSRALWVNQRTGIRI